MRPYLAPLRNIPVGLVCYRVAARTFLAQESQLSKPRMSVTKRQREQKKRDRQQKKAEKKALRVELKGHPEGSEIEEQEIVSEIVEA